MPSDIIVAGLGNSVKEFAKVAHEYITVGVNDIDKYFAPTHLVVLDPSRRFSDERRKIIQNTKASVVWTTPEWPCFKDDPRQKKLTTLRFDNKNTFNVDKDIPHYRTSPFAAIGLAYRLGAKRIGLIGVDLLPDHHMHKFEKVINEQLGRLSKMFLERETILVNLSQTANLYKIPAARLSFIQKRGYV